MELQHLVEKTDKAYPLNFPEQPQYFEIEAQKHCFVEISFEHLLGVLDFFVDLNLH